LYENLQKILRKKTTRPIKRIGKKIKKAITKEINFKTNTILLSIIYSYNALFLSKFNVY